MCVEWSVLITFHVSGWLAALVRMVFWCVSQDFDDWSDVGLNTPKPPGLLQLFRNYRKITVDHSEYIEQLQRKINSLTSQILALQRENEMLNVKLRNTEK